jgi:Domain of unknown function (DUF4328)
VQPQAPISPDGLWMWNGSQWVPNPYRPMLAPPQAVPYESGSFRATLATIFLAGNVVGLLLVAAFDIVNASHMTQSNPGDTLTTVEGLLAILAVLSYYGTLIPAIVFFCMWVHRIVRNMPAIGSPDPRWSPSGAVWRCFVPILNLIHPLYSVLDAWRGASPGSRWTNVNMRKSIGAPALIAGWWAAWIVAGVVGRIGYFMSRGSDLSTQVAGAYVDVIDSVLFIVAAVLAIMVLRDVTSRQESKNQLIASGQLV